MKFESGERREAFEEGDGAGHNFSEIEKSTSEKKDLFPKTHVFPVFVGKNSEKQKKQLLFFFARTLSLRKFLVPVTPTLDSRPTAGSSGPIQPSAHRQSQSSAHKGTLQQQLRVLHFTVE